jgi:HD-GYP domain-containing protein (c-di-GMP phosphodiesterase class II)
MRVDSMEGLRIYKNGTCLKKSKEISQGNFMHCLASEKGIEVIKDIMPKGTMGFIHSTSDEKNFDMIYLLKGKMILHDLDKAELLQTGDYYLGNNLKKDLLFKVIEDCETLYINNEMIYQEATEGIIALNTTMMEIQKIDGDTAEHCIRVTNLCMGIAYHLNYRAETLRNLFIAARFHDVGKCHIPAYILLKPGKLTLKEYETMKKHSGYTYEILCDHFGEDIAAIANGHHERLDGNGYPNGLKSDEISVDSRIICVADAYDAMTVSRPYHSALTQDEALAELRRCENMQFDTDVVSALVSYLKKEEELFAMF